MINSMYLINSDDIKTLHYHDWFLSRIEQTRGTLNYICEYSNEKLASIDNESLVTLYLRSVNVIYTIIESSYTATSKSFNVRTKKELILFLYSASKLQLAIGKVIWATRTTEANRKILNMDTEYAEFLYRCLRHIISDESLAYDYKIYTYNDCEYTEEELWDYYFAHNAEHPDKCDLERFLIQADTCLRGPIRHWNLRMLE